MIIEKRMSKTKWYLSLLILIAFVVAVVFYLEKWICNWKFFSNYLGVVFIGYFTFYLIWSLCSDSKAEIKRRKSLEEFNPPKFDNVENKYLLIQLFDHMSGDTRILWQLNWQIPTFAITTASVVILAGVGYVKNPLVSGVLLVVGSLLDLVLFVSLRKHNLRLSARWLFLEELETHLKLPRFPHELDEQLNYLEVSGKRRFKWFDHLSYRRPADTGLEISLFLLSTAVFLMGIYELLFFTIL